MKILYVVIAAVLSTAILSLLFAFPLMWLWNWLMPTIFELTEITFWQALGLMFLSGMLFKSTYSNSKD